MYINRSELKINAKRTMHGGYWVCFVAALVLAIATGSIGANSGVRINTAGSTESFGNGWYGANIESYGLDDIIRELDIPAYMLGTFAVILVFVMTISILLTIFLLQPLEVGCRKFFINARQGNYNLGDMGAAFSHSYLNVVKIMFLRNLYVFLWSLLLIIPGIIKSYEYRMIPYILAENPDISSEEAFALTKRMMTGSKMDSFWFDLSFILWFMLDALTCGLLGLFYVNPYYYNASAELYALLRTKAYPGVQYVYNERGYGNDSYNNTGYGSNGYGPSYGQNNPGQYNYGQNNSGQYNAGQNNAGQYNSPANAQGQIKDTTVPAEDARPFNRPYGE